MTTGGSPVPNKGRAGVEAPLAGVKVLGFDDMTVVSDVPSKEKAARYCSGLPSPSVMGAIPSHVHISSASIWIYLDKVLKDVPVPPYIPLSCP